MAEWYRKQTTEKKRSIVLARDPEKVKKSDLARYYRNWEKRRAAADAYHRDHQEQVNANKKRWDERNLEKKWAQTQANNAVRDGKLIKQPCEMSSTGDCNGRVEKHHADYSKPLEVTWLCVRHHNLLHRKHQQWTP